MAAGLTLGAIVLGGALRAGGVVPTEPVLLEQVPTEIGEWRSRDMVVTDRVHDVLRSDALLSRAYETEDGRIVWSIVDYHATQRLSATVHSPRLCYPGAGWRVAATEIATLHGHPVAWLDLENERGRMVAAYWYETRHGPFADELHLKGSLVRSSWERVPNDAATIRVSTPVEEGGRAAAVAQLTSFLALATLEFRSALPFGADSP